MTMFLLGGSPADAPDQAVEDFVSTTKRHGKRIGVALVDDRADLSPDQVDEFLTSAWAPFKDSFAQAKLEPVWLNSPADDPDAWPESPEHLAGLIVGFDAADHTMTALMRHRPLISRMVRSGVPYFGWALGAQAVGRHLITGGWRHDERMVAPESVGAGSDEITMTDALALIGPSVETRGDLELKIGRALAATQANLVRSVVVLDHDASLIVDAASGRTSASGPGRAVWVVRDGSDVVVRFEGATDVKSAT